MRIPQFLKGLGDPIGEGPVAGELALSDLLCFDWEDGGRLRGAPSGKDDGIILAEDACRLLDLQGDPGRHLVGLDADEKGLISIETLGGHQRVLYVTLSGFLALTFRSRKPAAKRIRKWVTSEVIPAILKSGAYSLPGAKPVIDHGWAERFAVAYKAHQAYTDTHFPGGWTVLTASLGDLLSLEDEFVRHFVPTIGRDLPDGSMGLCWGYYLRHDDDFLPPSLVRLRERGLTRSIGKSKLFVPQYGWDVSPHVYSEHLLVEFRRWKRDVYVPMKLPNYLLNNRPAKEYGKLVAASIASNYAEKNHGIKAILPGKLATQLDDAGGFVPSPSRDIKR